MKNYKEKLKIINGHAVMELIPVKAIEPITSEIAAIMERASRPTAKTYGEWLARSPRRKIKGWQR